MLGRGGVTVVARVVEMSRNTVITGTKEIRSGQATVGKRVRREGSGRRRLIDRHPTLLLELDELVSPKARSDPKSPLRWTAKSTYHLADALGAKGYEISPKTVGELLAEIEGTPIAGPGGSDQGAPVTTA